MKVFTSHIPEQPDQLLPPKPRTAKFKVINFYLPRNPLFLPSQTALPSLATRSSFPCNPLFLPLQPALPSPANPASAPLSTPTISLAHAQERAKAGDEKGDICYQQCRSNDALS